MLCEREASIHFASETMRVCRETFAVKTAFAQWHALGCARKAEKLAVHQRKIESRKEARDVAARRIDIAMELMPTLKGVWQRRQVVSLQALPFKAELLHQVAARDAMRKARAEAARREAEEAKRKAEAARRARERAASQARKVEAAQLAAAEAKAVEDAKAAAEASEAEATRMAVAEAQAAEDAKAAAEVKAERLGWRVGRLSSMARR